ncbi:MAG: DUF4296 domain-containing protein [Bacteroidales bacterium]
MKKYIPLLLVLFLVGACNQVPDGVLNRKQMENVLYEVHVAEGIMEEYPAQYRTPESKQQLLATVFYDNGITKAEFDSSMVYYGAHLDQYMKIYQKVTERLNAQKDIATNALTAYERSLQTPPGDSVDIWKKPAERILDPALLATASVFEIKGDSNFHADDRLIWNMRFNNLPVDSLGYVYVSFGADIKDSILQTTGLPAHDGWFTLELNIPKMNSNDRIFGSVALISRKQSLATPVYIDSISLMRYKKVVKELSSENKLKSDSIATDSLTTDSIKITDSIK